MCAGIMNKEQVTDINFRQHSVYGKFIVVFAQATGYVILMVAGSVFLAHNSNMMIGTIDSGTHQVSSAGITTDIFFVDMLLVDSGSYQSASM